eukprot:358831-Chlamydomonas_euryale.AAC.1
MSFFDLDESSPRLSTPPKCRIQLRDHQETLLAAMWKLEQEDALDDISTRIGVVADMPGSGKSYVVLALMLMGSEHLVSREKIYHSYSNGLVCHTESLDARTIRASNTNLLVIPHNLKTQWVNYINQMTPPDFRYRVVSTAKDIQHLQGYDLIVVTNTQYVNLLCDANQNHHFRRVVYDEAVHIALKGCEQASSNYYSFVSASYENILYPYSCYLHNRTIQGIKCNGFIKETFHKIDRNVVERLIVKNKDEYVSRSLQLPPVNNQILFCKSSNILNVVDGLVDKHVVQALNANDPKKALEYLSRNACTEESIISVLLSSFQKKAQTVQLRKAYLDTILDDTRHVEKLDEVAHGLENKIKDVIDRVKDSNICPICYETVQEGCSWLVNCQAIYSTICTI